MNESIKHIHMTSYRELYQEHCIRVSNLYGGVKWFRGSIQEKKSEYIFREIFFREIFLLIIISERHDERL